MAHQKRPQARAARPQTVLSTELVPASQGALARKGLDRWNLHDPRERLRKVFQNWIDSKKPSTVRAYKKDIEYFCRYLEVKSVEEALTFMGEDQGRANSVVLDYIKFLQTRKNEGNHVGDSKEFLKPATIQRYIASIKSLMKMSRLLGFSTVTIEARMPFKVTQYKDTAGPSEETVFRILDYYEDSVASVTDQKLLFKLLRDHAIVRLMISKGFRRGEIVSLDMEHVDWGKEGIYIHGKGRHEREFEQPPARAMSVLREWFNVREEAFGKSGALFVSRDGERVSGSSLYFIVDDLEKTLFKDEKDVKLAPHRFRHYAITQVAKSKDLTAAAAFARHSNPATTMRYIDNLEKRGAVAAQTVEDEFERKRLERRKEKQ